MTDVIASSPPPTDDADLAAVRVGAVLWKLRSSNAWYRRRYWVDTQNMRLHYEPSHKPFWCNAKQHVDILDIKDARLGWKTGLFVIINIFLDCNDNCFYLLQMCSIWLADWRRRNALKIRNDLQCLEKTAVFLLSMAGRTKAWI